MFNRDIDWLENIIVKLIEYDGNNLREFYKIAVLWEANSLQDSFRKSSIPEVFIKYYMIWHNKQMNIILKQIDDVEWEWVSLKNTMISFLISAVTEWILEWYLSERNYNPEKYLKPN
jgi:hypothetical protein